MALIANQAIASWNITGKTLYSRTFDNGETFWLCEQFEGTPGGAVDTFLAREGHMLNDTDGKLTWMSGYNSTTGPALATEFEKHQYPGEANTTSTRTVNGLGKGYPVNFSIPQGYAKTPVGSDNGPGIAKAQTTAAKATAAQTDANGNPVKQTFIQKFKYWIIGAAVAVVGVVVYVATRKKGKKRP